MANLEARTGATEYCVEGKVPTAAALIICRSRVDGWLYPKRSSELIVPLPMHLVCDPGNADLVYGIVDALNPRTDAMQVGVRPPKNIDDDSWQPSPGLLHTPQSKKEHDDSHLWPNIFQPNHHHMVLADETICLFATRYILEIPVRKT